MDLGSEITNQIKSAIKTKLEELGSYVDNELPDYIMVMLSNKRGKKQMTDDLMLFLGENTVKFIDWLTNLVDKLKDVTSLVEASQEDPMVILPQDVPEPEKEVQTEVEEQSIRNSAPKDKRKSPTQPTSKENSQSKSSKSANNRSERSRGSTSSGRQGSLESRHSSRKRRLSDDDDDDTSINPQVSSVVKVQEKRPSLPPSKQATSSLLKRAVAAAHMSVTKIHNLTYDPTSPPSPIKVHSLEEKQHQKEILLQQHRELQQQLKTNELEQLVPQEPENGHYEHVNKEVPDLEQKPKENKNTEIVNEPVIELQVSEAEALEYCAEPVKGDTRIVAFADSQTATEPEEEKHKRRKKRAVKSRERPRSPKFIVTLDGVDSELENKFEKQSKDKDKHKKSKTEFDDYVEIDTSNIPVTTQTELSPEKVEFTAPPVEQVMFRLDNTSDDEEILQMSVAGRPQERCRFWPDCMNGSNCPFYHPSTPCRTFPNCKFSDKCLFIHPLCKYDGRCANTTCPFMHKPKPKQIAVPVKPPPDTVPQVDESLPTLTKITPCKFFPGCTRSNCPFLHPKANVTKICRYGSTCSRIDCMFNHPPSKAALKWVAPSLHISERSFAIPGESVTKLPVAS